jgi:hypothetical protein
MTAQPKSGKRGTGQDDGNRPSLADFLRPSRYPQPTPPDPAPADTAAGVDADEEDPVPLAQAEEDRGALAGGPFEAAPDDEQEEGEEEEEHARPTTPERPARSHAGSSLRPLTIDPRPPTPLDHELDEELASLLPVSRLPATRRIIVPVAVALAGCVVAFAARRLITPRPSDARPHEIPAAEMATVEALPIPPEPPDIDDTSGEDLVGPEEQIELGRKAALEARRLLEAGQIEQGVAEARRAIALDPRESRNYILLAAGLQDLGKWQEAREIFTRCTKQSDGIANAECIYFATHGR